MAEPAQGPAGEEEEDDLPPLEEVQDDEEEGGVVQEKPVESDFCLEILPLIKEAQNQHGLRHGDYQRYRMYCSRRLRRVRKSLHFTQGHRSRYHKKAVTLDKVSDIRYLLIPLICSERSWALAMEIKQAANTEPRKRFHMLRRLNRSIKHASELLQLCEKSVRCDARTRLEAQAYSAWIVGNVRFEQQKWQEALDGFSQSQTIYEKLGGVVTEEQRALYAQRVEELVPSIRYCVYNIGDMPSDITQLMNLRTDAPGSDMLSSKIDEVLAKTQEKAATSLTEVTWLGKKLPVRSEKLRVSLVKLQQLEVQLSRAQGGEEKMDVFEKLLMECQDAMQIVRDEITAEKALPEKKQTVKSEAQRTSLRSLLDYFTHVKLSHAISRNLQLIDTMNTAHSKPASSSGGAGGRVAKPEEFVRVYDILLQHLSDLSEIPGLEDDLAVQKENAARTFAFKAFRCFHLAKSYVVMRRWAEAVGLFDRASAHVTQSLELYREVESSREPSKTWKSLVPELQQLRETIRGKKCEVHVNSIMENQDIEDKMTDLTLASKPLTERMDQFVLTPPSHKVTIAPLPPEYRPIPCKPLFFDLALNHIEFPSLEHRVEKKQGGITGFMKGLIWGKS